MTLVFAIAVYFIIWWLVLFAVLPIGMRTQGEAGEVVPGTPASAPTSPRLLRVAGITTVVAALIFALVYAVIEYKLISIGDLPSLVIPSGTNSL